MKLYFLPGAPSPDRVRLYISEKNSMENVIRVDEISLAGGKQKEPAHLARNRLAKVPVPEVAECAGLFGIAQCVRTSRFHANQRNRAIVVSGGS